MFKKPPIACQNGFEREIFAKSNKLPTMWKNCSFFDLPLCKLLKILTKVCHALKGLENYWFSKILFTYNQKASSEAHNNHSWYEEFTK